MFKFEKEDKKVYLGFSLAIFSWFIDYFLYGFGLILAIISIFILKNYDRKRKIVLIGLIFSWIRIFISFIPIFIFIIAIFLSPMTEAGPQPYFKINGLSNNGLIHTYGTISTDQYLDKILITAGNKKCEVFNVTLLLEYMAEAKTQISCNNLPIGEEATIKLYEKGKLIKEEKILIY